MIGQIKESVYTLPSTKYVICDGRELSIEEYPELYSAIGRIYTLTTTASTKFNVPKLTDRVCVGFKSTASKTPVESPGIGVENYGAMGNVGGSNYINLTVPQYPLHYHIGQTGRSTQNDNSGGDKRYYVTDLTIGTVTSYGAAANGNYNGGVTNNAVNNSDYSEEANSQYVENRMRTYNLYKYIQYKN
jgi:microcystin-dependent protein